MKRKPEEWHHLVDVLAGMCDLAGHHDLADALDIVWDADGTTGVSATGVRMRWHPPRIASLDEAITRIMGQWVIADAWVRRHLRNQIREVAERHIREGLAGADRESRSSQANF